MADSSVMFSRVAFDREVIENNDYKVLNKPRIKRDTDVDTWLRPYQ